MKGKRSVVVIPDDINARLGDFSKQSGIPITKLAAVGLTEMLERILSGKAAIVNGRLVEVSKKAA
jgi:hypothetical protein